MANKDYDDETNDKINNKIYDYIMEKLYKYLFAKEPDINDHQIYQNCKKHIWIDFRHLVKDTKIYIFDNYLADVNNYIHQFECEKSPRKKIIFINEIFNCIYHLGKLNEDNIDNTDKELVLLTLAFIKSKPQRIYSNCKYTELFLGGKSKEKEGSQLYKMLSICENVKQLQFESLYKINITDYRLYCDLSLKKILY